MASGKQPVKPEARTDEESIDSRDKYVNKITEACLKSPDGISNDIMQSLSEPQDREILVAAMNYLLRQNKLIILRDKAGKQSYKLRDVQSAAVSESLTDKEENIVFQIIEQSGNQGIWIKDIRYKSNLLQAQLNKVLKSLEIKQLVKAVKTVGASKKKIYMLYGLTPDKSLTGGAWYSDQDFETEFVDILNQQCMRYLELRAEKAAHELEKAGGTSGNLSTLRLQSFVSADDVCRRIGDLGVSKIQLTTADIEVILDTLVYDGKAEKDVVTSSEGNSSSLYRALRPLIRDDALVRTPCGICPVRTDCSIDGVISPKSCIYFDDWLTY